MEDYFNDSISNLIEKSENKSIQVEAQAANFISNLFNDSYLICESNLLIDKQNNLSHAKTFKSKLKLKGSIVKVFVKKIRTNKEIHRIVETLCHLKHENIIQFYGLCPSLDLIVMEFNEGMTLKAKLINLEYISNDTIFDWAKQIAKAMKILHSKDILHRDLSSNNIMIETIGKFSRLKLIDINDTNSIGTPLNMAPEAFENRLSQKSDVFSYGCVLWEIVTCLKQDPFEKIKFKDLNTNCIAFKIIFERKTLKIPSNCDLKWSQLMKDCWMFEPEERPLFCQIWERLNKINF